jgi:carboxymethylenebutenolidase
MRRNALLLVASALVLAACSREKSDEHASHTTAQPAPSATTTAPAADAGPLVRYPSVNGEGSGYLAAPATPAKKPGLIVIHEWWGLDNWVREQTDRFAGQGGRVAKTPDEAHELMRGLPEDRALADLIAAFNYLASRPDVDPNLIGVIGWCMGGGYALQLELNEPRIAATAINYGRLVTDFDTITKISSPLLGNFGAADRGIPAEDVKAFGATLTKAGKLADLKVYEGAGHAFMNPNNKEGYNAEASADAWRRIDSFFDRTLRAKIPNS